MGFAEGKALEGSVLFRFTCFSPPVLTVRLHSSPLDFLVSDPDAGARAGVRRGVGVEQVHLASGGGARGEQAQPEGSRCLSGPLIYGLQSGLQRGLLS